MPMILAPEGFFVLSPTMPCKFIKVSHPGRRVLQLKSTVIGLLAKGILTATLCAAAMDPAAADSTVPIAAAPADKSVIRPDLPRSDCLFEPALDTILLAALDRMYRMDYAGADSLLATLPAGPARSYFQGIALINRFDDLGDTAALFRAEALWEGVYRSTDAPGNPDAGTTGPAFLYRGLSAMQLSYVAGLTGSAIRSAHLARKAVAILRPGARFAEAEAALALYDYYKADLLKGVEWMPFVAADRTAPLRRLETAIPRSRYLREVLHTSLLWLYYDAGRYGDGLRPIEAFLARYPGNRFYRKIQADFLFRKGALDSALGLQEGLAREYLGLRKICPSPACLPIGYLSSVGNLAKIHSSQKHPESLKRRLATWNSPEHGGTMKWLPGSLKREVRSLGK